VSVLQRTGISESQITELLGSGAAVQGE